MLLKSSSWGKAVSAEEQKCQCVCVHVCWWLLSIQPSLIIRHVSFTQMCDYKSCFCMMLYAFFICWNSPKGQGQCSLWQNPFSNALCQVLLSSLWEVLRMYIFWQISIVGINMLTLLWYHRETNESILNIVSWKFCWRSLRHKVKSTRGTTCYTPGQHSLLTVLSHSVMVFRNWVS